MEGCAAKRLTPLFARARASYRQILGRKRRCFEATVCSICLVNVVNCHESPSLDPEPPLKLMFHATVLQLAVGDILMNSFMIPEEKSANGGHAFDWALLTRSHNFQRPYP